ncbi:MAG: trigger factor [Gammaproteobacteria bacterium]|nr:trigger factor [Gammaproteobacteria bacterium]
MEVSLENTGALERRMQIAVPEELITSKVQSKLENLSRTTRIQGFRPGKVPMKVIRSRFGDQVRKEVVSEVLQSSFQEAIVEKKLRPAGMPTIDPIKADSGEGLSYTATFEVYPELELAPVEAIEIERPVAKIGPDDIEKMIGLLQKQNSTLETCDREAVEGDVLVIDFEGKIDGEVFDGGSATDFQVELGSKRLIEGFEQGLIGARAGEQRQLDLKFPKEYQKADLAGKAVTFNVTVKEVKAVKLPELDENFFKLFGVTDGGLEAFREEVRTNMEREAGKSSQNRVRDAILDKLFEQNQFEVPRVMLEAESKRLLDEMKEQMTSRGMDASMLKDLAPDTYEEQARKRVSLQLILSEIIKQNGMKADPNRVRALIEQHAANYEDPGAIVNWYYADKNRLAEVEALALEGEVIDWILAKCKVKDVEIPFDEIMNTGQTGSA